MRWSNVAPDRIELPSKRLQLGILYLVAILLMGFGVWKQFLTPTWAALLLIPIGFGIGLFSLTSDNLISWGDLIPVLAPWLVPLLLLTGLAGFLAVALYRREASGLTAAAMFVLGGLTIWFACLFLSSVRNDGPPHFESYWCDIAA